VRFQDAAPDARAIVYAGIQADATVSRAALLLADATYEQRLLARAVMNGESTDPAAWRAIFPSLFGGSGDGAAPPDLEHSEAILAASLAVADRGEQARSQYRGAIVESVTELLLRRAHGAEGATAVRRERRVLFDGVRAEIHPYDVTVEVAGSAAAVDCKWGARGISADVLYQLEDARTHAADEDDESLSVILVIFDAQRSCSVRLDRQTAPHEGTRFVSIETLDDLAASR